MRPVRSERRVIESGPDAVHSGGICQIAQCGPGWRHDAWRSVSDRLSANAQRLRARFPGDAAVLTLTMLAIAPGSAIAQPEAGADPFAGMDHSGTPPLPPKTDELLPQTDSPGKKRRLPSYDGRKPARLTAGQVLVWIPRVLFFPVYATLEYVLRWPLVKLITLIEKYHLINYARGVFSLGSSNAVLLPTLFVDFSRFASVGFYFSYKDLGVKKNKLVVQAGIWTGSWYHAVVKDRFSIFAKDEGTVTLRTELIWRPDYAFHGLGPDTRQQDESFFRLRLTEVELSLHARLKDLNRVYVGVLYRNVKSVHRTVPLPHLVDARRQPLFEHGQRLFRPL